MKDGCGTIKKLVSDNNSFLGNHIIEHKTHFWGVNKHKNFDRLIMVF